LRLRRRWGSSRARGPAPSSPRSSWRRPWCPRTTFAGEQRPAADCAVRKDSRMEGLGTGVDAGGCLQRRSKPSRSHASRSDRPSWAAGAHGRHHAGRDGRTSSHRVRMQIGEVVISEHLVPVICEEAVNRAQLQPITQEILGFSKRCWVCEVPSAMYNSVSWAGESRGSLATTSANS